jgi:thymidylate synthase (FAD)
MKKLSEKEKAITYYKKICKVEILNETYLPLSLLYKVLDNTIKGKEDISRLQNIIKKGHTSFLEFIDITFKISPITSSALNQITRHRQASFMSSSYHYSKVETNTWILPFIKGKYSNEINNLFLNSKLYYDNLLKEGVLKEEARNILPQAITYSLIMKINARSLFNFFNLRLCNRNIPEMVAIAQLIHRKCMHWLPEIFSLSGPDCKISQCKQGEMKCD